MENGKNSFSALRIFAFVFVLSIFHFPFSIFLGEAQSATYYMDYVSGSDSNDGSTWALAKKTINGYTAAIIVPGDIIRIAKSTDPTSLGITATWTNLSKTVTLASALTANVDLCETAWTASTNVTATASTTQKEGSNSSSLAIAAGFTTGKAAYKTISSTDYSGYQQLSFWIRASAQVNSGVLRIDLCSDTLGATPVDSFTINTTLYANQFYPLTIDKGSALGSAIQSVALYCISDPGTVTVLLDDIITAKAAANADALSLTSLIGKNTAGETWYGIKSVNGTTVILDNHVNSEGESGRGYAGTTETVTTYKRETIKTTPVAAGTAVQTVQDNGSSGSLITFSGGWNTATTTQDGETWFDGQNGLGYGIVFTSRTYTKLEKTGLVRYDYGTINAGGAGSNLTAVYGNNNTTYGIQGSSTNGLTLSSLICNNNGTTGFSFGLGTTCYNNTFTSIVGNNNGSTSVIIVSPVSTVSTLTARNNGSTGVYLGGGNMVISSVTSSNNATYGLQLTSLSSDDLFYNCTFSGNTTADIIIPLTYYGSSNSYFYHCLFSSTFELASTTTTFGKSHIYSYRHDQVQGRFKVWQTYSSGASSGTAGIISDQITGGQTAGWARGGSGTCLYLDPQQTTAGRELSWTFWVPVTASTSTTVSFYHKITTNFNGSLKITVYDSDDNITKLIDAATITLTNNGSWNQYTSSGFTPTDTGFCRVVLEALNGATTGDIGIDDVTLSPDPDVNQGGMDRWMEGLPPEYITDATASGPAATEQSYGYVN